MKLDVQVKRLGPGDIVLDGDGTPPHGKGHSSGPLSPPMSIVAKTVGWTKMPFGTEETTA